ncbi:S-adenosylmethionine mitochondrial carrier, partial [Brachionus plicatilis]
MEPNTFWISLFSGAAAGSGVDLILFPLDTFKTRIQSQQGFWASGGFRGIYNGLPSTLVGSAPTAALFFTIYDTTKSKLDYYVAKNYINPTLCQIVAANLGEISACLIRVPVDVVRQKTQAQHNLNTVQIMKKIFKTEGFRGFYRSYLTTVLREIPFGSVQFPLWEYLKLTVSKYAKDGESKPYQSALCGAVAGGISAGITTPI